jgi:uncharacterized membrane protein YvbJ
MSVQCAGCGKTTTADQLRDGLCGLCVYDRDKAKISAENAELEATSRAKQRKQHIATTISVLITVLAIVGYIVAKYISYNRANERAHNQYKEY